MTVFSVTDRSTFKTCREQWDWVSLSRQGLSAVMPNKALLLGTLIHYTFADWLTCPVETDPLWVNPVERFNAHFSVAELDIYKSYGAKFNSVMDFDEFERMYGEPVRDLGAAMIKNYYDDHQGPGLLDGFRVVAVEQTVTIPVPGTEHCVCTKRGFDKVACCETGAPYDWIEKCEQQGCLERHSLEGTFDALLADARGRLFIVDHKTYERRPSQNELLYNDQFLAYTWMANQLGLGEVGGVIYNGLWKRAEPPKGRTREDLYYKTFLPHSQDEIREFGSRLAVELNEMGNNPAIYLNRNWYSCPFCPVTDLCLAKSRGEDYQAEADELVPRTKTPAWRAV